MAKVLESLIAKGRRARRPPEQKEVAFGLADLSTHGLFFPLSVDSPHCDLLFRGIIRKISAERRSQVFVDFAYEIH